MPKSESPTTDSNSKLFVFPAVRMAAITLILAAALGFCVVILWMNCMATFMDHSVESVLLVCCVLDGPDSAIGVVHSVGPLQHVSVSVFVLTFHIPCVVVFYSIVEGVFRMCLDKQRSIRMQSGRILVVKIGTAENVILCYHSLYF